MGKESSIQWTDSTWNPFHGCRKVSEGCKYCYMYRDKERYGQDPTVVLKSKGNFNMPLKYKDPLKIFTCSWSDFFIEEGDQYRDELWDIIKRTPQHTYQILTKRPERIKDHLPSDWGTGYKNVWLGVSAENQERAEQRISILLTIPSHVRFVSAEPLLGPIDLTSFSETWSAYSNVNFNDIKRAIEKLDWIIIGGESGNDKGKYLYRDCKIDWIKSLLQQCKKYETPIFIKQMGTHLAKELDLSDRHGGDMEEWPEVFQIRQFPNK